MSSLLAEVHLKCHGCHQPMTERIGSGKPVWESGESQEVTIVDFNVARVYCPDEDEVKARPICNRHNLHSAAYAPENLSKLSDPENADYVAELCAKLDDPAIEWSPQKTTSGMLEILNYQLPEDDVSVEGPEVVGAV